jgi:hypothetical protein
MSCSSEETNPCSWYETTKSCAEWTEIAGKKRIHYWDMTFQWVETSWTPNCYWQRENPNNSAAHYETWSWAINQYVLRCWGNSIFASYTYEQKLAKYPALKACANLWVWRHLPTQTEFNNFYTKWNEADRPQIFDNNGNLSSIHYSFGDSEYSSSTECEYNGALTLVIGLNGSYCYNKNEYHYILCLHD